MAGRDVLGGLQDEFGDGADLGGGRLTNSAEPVNPSDLATKNYADTLNAVQDTAIDVIESYAPVVVTIALGGVAFDIVSDKVSVTMGPAIFKIHNVAGSAHELLLVKTDTSAADIIASVGVGGTWDETDQDIRFDTESLAAGHYARADVNLEVGHFVLLCNLAGHVHLGMALDFNVTLKTGATANDIVSR